MPTEDRPYYRSRLEQERSAEAVATSLKARDAHRQLGDRYAARLEDSQDVSDGA